MSTYTEYREQRRADQAVAAEQVRADRAAANEARLQEMQVRAQLGAHARQVADERSRANRDAVRAVWSRRWAMVKAWAREEAPATVVMGVPMLLAWSAMAAYGREIFGPLGVGLAAFSEGALLWFALEIPRAQRQDRPTGWLRVGLVVFGVVAAGLNAVHGFSMADGGWDRAVVMAVVSVGGVAVHQLITAGPRVRRTGAERRAQRMADRVAREVARREHRAQLAAVRAAVAEIDENGRARLVYEPGRVAPTQTRPPRGLSPAAAPSTVQDTERSTLAIQPSVHPSVQCQVLSDPDTAVQSAPVAGSPEGSEPLTAPRAVRVQSVTVEPSSAPAKDRARAAARSHHRRTGSLPTVTELVKLSQVSRGTAGTALQELREAPADLHLVDDENQRRNSS
jgi:hypothetical protein